MSTRGCLLEHTSAEGMELRPLLCELYEYS